MAMRVLTIETSTPIAEAALVADGRVVAAERLATGRERGRELLVAVRNVLSLASCSVRDVDTIAVSIGPGRFSGLRVGLATAKGLAVAYGITLTPVPTLEALARSAGAYEGVICPMLDARRGEVYCAVYRASAGFERLAADIAAPPAAAAGMARDAAGGEPVLFVGTGANEYAREIRDHLGPVALFPRDEILQPSACVMAEVAESLSRDEDTDIARLEPVYLRGI